MENHKKTQKVQKTQKRHTDVCNKTKNKAKTTKKQKIIKNHCGWKKTIIKIDSEKKYIRFRPY